MILAGLAVRFDLSANERDWALWLVLMSDPELNVANSIARGFSENRQKNI